MKRKWVSVFVLSAVVLGVCPVHGAAGKMLSGVILAGSDPLGTRTTATVTLQATGQFFFPGQTLVVQANLSNASGLITGGQFFLEYNTSKLEFLNAVPGNAPFVQELIEAIGPGTLDYAVGVLPGDPGTAADTTMAVIRFRTLTGVCAGSNLVSFRQHEPPSKLVDADGESVSPTLVNLGPITIDSSLPSIICPQGLTIECTDSTLPSHTGSASATDNCDATPTITYSDNITPSGCTGVWDIARTWRAADDTGNLRSCEQVITVRDTTDPVITCPADITTNAAPGSCGANLNPGLAAATDNCDPASAIAGLRDDSLPLIGDYEAGDTQIFWEATDCAGNSDTCTQVVTVIDSENPSITCPANITSYADAGGTDAFVNVPPPPFLQDNCGILYVMNDYNGMTNASDTYPQGPTPVTWTITDVYGNTAQCSHTVTVVPLSQLAVSVQFSPTVFSPLTRCITFDLYKCGTGQHATVSQAIAFTYGLALEQVLEVPAFNGAYDCITARDRRHTLRRTSNNFRIVGARYVASFTGDVASGGDWLIGGNFNDDIWVDILDFGIMSMEWAKTYDSDGNSIPDGNTTCSTPYPHADVSGNGVVNLGDFTFIQINFLKQSEANCCGLFREDETGPRESVTVDELQALGLGEMAVADFNGDGVVDAQDVAAFMSQASPRAQWSVDGQSMEVTPRP